MFQEVIADTGLIASIAAATLCVFLSVILEWRITHRNKKTETILVSLNESVASQNDPSTRIKFDDVIDELIQNHHKQALLQATIQFWFSLIAALIGFCFIIAIIAFSQEAQWYENLIKVIPGVVIEVVSVLFFTQSKETRQQSSDFLNRLRQDRQYEKSIVIADTISDEELRAKLKAEIALHLCGINKSPDKL